jgi:hypothetical protein
LNSRIDECALLSIDALVNYKMLCEKRIKQLDPSHSLPVTPEVIEKNVGAFTKKEEGGAVQRTINELRNGKGKH